MREMIAGRRTKAEAADVLGVTRRTLNRYLVRFAEAGPAGLADRRRSNFRKVDATIETAVVQAKQHGPHRSARFLRDHLRLPVAVETVRRILVKHHLERTSLPPIKPIQRFEAPAPNALWQIDIQGKVHFPLLGDLLLVLVKDDHSRFLLAGRWFFHQYKINVFMVLHEAFRHWGLPTALLSDRGPQFWAHQLHAETEYQAWVRRVGVQPRYGRKARTKGKLENNFRFVQRDFVLEHLDAVTLDTLNGAWGEWMGWYNWHHPHKGLNQECPADRYTPSLRRPTAEDLELLLIHEEPRKVLRTGHITYYGQYYQVPDRYIGRRVWTLLKGDRLTIECNRESIAVYQVKTDYLEAVSRDR